MIQQINDMFLKLASNYGYGVACSVVFIGLILYLILHRVGIKIGDIIPDTIFNSWVSKKRVGTKKDLLEHELFQSIDYLLNYRLHNVQTSCKLRERLFMDILSIRFRIIQEELKKLIEQEDLYTDNDNKKFGMALLSASEAIYSRWYEECEKEGIPLFILNKFDSYFGPFLGMGRTAILSIFNASYINTSNYSKLYISLNLINSFENWLFSELEKLLNTFNGDVVKLTYKGVSCQHCPVCVHKTESDTEKKETILM